MIPKSALWIGILAFVVAALLGLGGWFFFRALQAVQTGSYIAVGYLVLGVACFLATGIILAFPLSRVFSMPFGSLFYPDSRFDRPQPPYSRAEAALKRGDPEGAITLYREMAEAYPDEVRPYIGMMDIAAHDLQDLARTKAFYREGMSRLQDMQSQRVLNKMYRANMSRLAGPPSWGQGKIVNLDRDTRGMKIATFNANSIRLRLPVILGWMEEHGVDVVAVQETKVQDAEFPEAAVRDAGLDVVYRGQKSYNGVAILSRHPITGVRAGFDDGEPPDETRLLQVTIGPVTLVNTYVPQGRDVSHEMYAYKCRWLERLRTYFDANFTHDDALVWLGDMNVAHDPIDVYNPQDRAKHVCYHDDARRAFAHCRAWGFEDVLRKHHPEGGLYTFFDYRSTTSVKNGQGWRIDYILTPPALAGACTGCEIDVEPRKQPKASDHTFQVATFDV